MEEQRLQGTDITVEFTFQNSLSAPILPSSLVDYVIEVFYFLPNKTKGPLLKFKKTPGAGEYQVNIIDDLRGVVNIVIPRSWTKSATPKVIYAEVKTLSTANATYEASKMVNGAYAFKICSIVESAVPVELI